MKQKLKSVSVDSSW